MTCLCFCVFGINQVQVVGSKIYIREPIVFGDNRARSIFCVEIICWKMQSSRSSSCWGTPPDCCPEQEKKKDEWLQRAWWSPGEEVESLEFSESLWSTLLFRPPSPQKTVNFKANFEEIPPPGKISPDRRAQECGGWSQILAPWARYPHKCGFWFYNSLSTFEN